MKQEKITILGDGAWATTLAVLLSENGHKVVMWSVFPEHLDVLDKKRENKEYLPGIKMPKNIKFEKDINEAIKIGDVVVDAIPSKFYRDVLGKVDKRIVKKKIFVNVSKGLEQKSLKRMTEIIHEELGKVTTAVLSGPTIAIEVAKKMPSVAVVASRNFDVAQRLQDMFSSNYFRVYTSNDVVGVELGGPLKNIIAVVAGISDGLGFGANTKAAILSRGMVEISRLGIKLGAQKKTFAGIAGLGDLSTTCISPDSRNRTLGERIAKGEKLKDILSSTNSIIEGATTTEAVYQLSKKYDIDMPLTKQVYLILYNEKSPQRALRDLMQRERKREVW